MQLAKDGAGRCSCSLFETTLCCDRYVLIRLRLTQVYDLNSVTDRNEDLGYRTLGPCILLFYDHIHAVGADDGRYTGPATGI